jgi:signal transduction histidine kinase
VSEHGARHWHRRLRRSLHWRLVAMFVLLALGMAAVFVLGSRQAFGLGWREVAQPLLRDYVDRLAAEVGSPPDRVRAQALVQRLPLTIRIDGPRIQWRSHPDAVNGPPTHAGEAPAWLARTTADGHTVRFGLALWHQAQRPRFIGWATLAGMGVLLLLAFGYVRHLLRPLDDIRAGALRYGQGDFSSPIVTGHADELRDLANDVNSMAQGLRQLLEGQRGLLLAISHELRSPLTRARLNAELVPEGEARDALLRDLGVMRQLITDLLESERLAGGRAALAIETVHLDEVVRAVQLAHFAGRPIDLDIDPSLPAVQGDRVRLELLVRNLLDNALRHNPPGALPVQVRLAHREGDLSIEVRDHGPGVAEAELDRLGQPFYRPDAARTRSSGGVGLGLYLCRQVARSHGGVLHIGLAQPGLRVQVILPVGGR